MSCSSCPWPSADGPRQQHTAMQHTPCSSSSSAPISALAACTGWQAAVEWPGRNVMMIDDHSGVTVLVLGLFCAGQFYLCRDFFRRFSTMPCAGRND
eukprot:SAG25_NODE_212_length_11793_cov_15.035146_2_plen_97_part_00